MQAQPEAIRALEGLHDIVVPTAVSWAPRSAGWYGLAVVAAAVVAWGVWVGYRRHLANRYRRTALKALAAIEQRVATPDPAGRARALAGLPTLLKRTALAAGHRLEVASLTGDAWLSYLDDTYGGTGFSAGPGRLLPTLAYASPSRFGDIAPTDVSALLALTRTWIRRHRGRS
jgi:hypothetical protein